MKNVNNWKAMSSMAAMLRVTSSCDRFFLWRRDMSGSLLLKCRAHRHVVEIAEALLLACLDDPVDVVKSRVSIGPDHDRCRQIVPRFEVAVAPAGGELGRRPL